MKSKLTMDEEQLARHWGVTTRTVRTMAEEQIAVATRGGFDVLESDRRLIAWLRRDEPTKRVKREVLRAQIQRREQEMARFDRKYLSPDEVAKYIDAAWAALRRGHAAVIGAFHRQAMTAPGSSEAIARETALRMEAEVLGEMVLCREELGRLRRKEISRLECHYRNGIFTAAREIRRLEDALL